MFIFWIAFVSIFVVVCSLIMIKYSDKFSFDMQPAVATLSFIVFIFGIIGSITTAFIGFEYISAKHKAQVINQEFGTNYTTKDIFYAEDAIEEIRQMKRHRIELNGNILNNKGE